MSKLKYLRRKDVLFKYCYLALSDHFDSAEDLENWYEQLHSEQQKDSFLKAGSYYFALVKSGDWHVNMPDSQPVIEYFTNSYKYIAIFSLIESLSDLQYVDFYQYLKRTEARTQFPLTEEELERKYSLYNQDYGAIRRCIRFFRNLSSERQQSLVSKLEVRNVEPSIENFAKYLYRLRSKFVHEAELIHQVASATWIGLEGKNVVVCSLSINDAMEFFEEGLLAWFEKSEE